MVKRPDSKAARQRRHKRVRGKISGTAACPRLSVFRSLSNIYAQIIDDTTGKTLVAASSVEKDFGVGGNKEAARKVGQTIGERAVNQELPRLYSTAVAISITAVYKNWPKVLVRAASSSN